MLTAFNQNPAVAVEGQLHGSDKATVPGTIPWKAQQSNIAIANSEAGSLVITVTDELTDQVYTVTVTVSGATEATTLDEMVAAWRAHGKLNQLASVAEDGVDDFTITFRHANRGYTVATTPPGSMTATVTEPQAHGGAKLRFGRFVVRGANSGEIDAPGSTSVLADVVGALYRTDGNHFHKLEGELPTDVDALDRGKRYPVLVAGRMWMTAGDAMAPGDRVYMVRESSNSDDLGTVRATATGGQQLWTYTPTASENSFGISFEYLGHTYTAAGGEPDGTTTATEIVTGLKAALGTISGLTIGGTSTLTIQTAAGTELLNPRNTDEGVGAWVETTAADVDAIDISSIAMVDDESPSAGAGDLVLIKVKGLT